MFKALVGVCVLGSLAFAQEVSPGVQAQLESYAQHCLVASDGSIWSYDLVQRASKVPGGLEQPPFNQSDAPLYHDIRSGESVRTQEQLKALLHRRLGHMKISGQVVEQQFEGVRLVAGGREIFVHTTDTFAERDLVTLWAQAADTYTYTTVAGASRTLRSYEVVSPVTLTQMDDWRALGRYLVAHKLQGLPRHGYHRRLVKPARFSQGENQAAEHRWEFVRRTDRLTLPKEWPSPQ